MRQEIYGLTNPGSELIRYIGCSNAPSRRLACHIRDAKRGVDNLRSEWIRSLLAKGKEPGLVVLFEVPSDEPWQDVERAVISHFRKEGFKLLNVGKGGEGPDITKAEIEEQRRESLKAAWAKRKVKAAHKKGVAEAITNGTFHDAQIKINSRPGMREQKSAASALANGTPEQRALFSAQQTERMKNPKYRKAVSKGTKKAWADPEHRAARLAKIQAGLQAAWNDPVKRAARLEKLRATYAKKGTEMSTTN